MKNLICLAFALVMASACSTSASLGLGFPRPYMNPRVAYAPSLQPRPDLIHAGITGCPNVLMPGCIRNLPTISINYPLLVGGRGCAGNGEGPVDMRGAVVPTDSVGPNKVERQNCVPIDDVPNMYVADDPVVHYQNVNPFTGQFEDVLVCMYDGNENYSNPVAATCHVKVHAWKK